jgi:drug/metabolite transporter (DMT)-like permease
MTQNSTFNDQITTPPRTLATFAGFGAIALWSSLALLTTLTGTIPPFQLAAMTFLVGSLVGLSSWLLRPGAAKALKQPWPVWLVGVGGLYGYHALYFAALRLAPPAEAGLVNYLWPLLIVIGSGLLPGQHLRLPSIIGGILGFAGVAVLILARDGLNIDPQAIPGYLCAFAAAFAWAAYSLLSSRFGEVPTDAVTGFCFVTAVLAAVSHLLFETTVWPDGFAAWAAIVGLGIGPVGAAFYLWDFGMKAGEIRTIGFASYATPVISTLLLVLADKAALNWALALSCALIAGGAMIARLTDPR